MMKEDETIYEYNARVYDISNESLTLGEPIANAKLVSKILRTLLDRFSMNVTTIKKTHDLEEMRLDELMGSLKTFEMNLKENEPENKIKGVALKAEVLMRQRKIKT